MKTIFITERLNVRNLSHDDEDLFFDMMSNPLVMDPIPQAVFNRKDSDAKLQELIAAEPEGKKMVWTITEHNLTDLIGICGLIINSDGNKEIAYRFRPEFWGKGYGSEIALNLLKYGFETLNYQVIDGDANTENLKSIRILEKYMTKIDEFWNENDQCFDVRYRTRHKEWIAMASLLNEKAK